MRRIRTGIRYFKSYGLLKFITKVLGIVLRGQNPFLFRSPLFLNPNTDRLAALVAGIHKVKGHPDFSFSVLVPVFKPTPLFLQEALTSYLNFSAPQFEVIAGLDGPQPDDVMKVLNELKAKYGSKLIIHPCERGGISRTTNSIASIAQGRFLVFADHDDLARPDLLWRYEQVLRQSRKDPDQMVLSCNELKIGFEGQVIHGTQLYKPVTTHFPYFFINSICHCLMVPSSLWKKVGGLRPACDGAQDYDLCLRLDLQGAIFLNVPIFLYAWRVHFTSTAKTIDQKDYATEAGLKALSEYAAQKNLPWTVNRGLYPMTYRPRLELPSDRNVHAIILYKDKEDLTNAAVDSLIRQKQVKVHVTLVDNNSDDKSIADRLRQKGCEVIRIEEPFNFSRLNNLAVSRSQLEKKPYLLIMNNDVELEPEAVAEMLPWLEQPNIGVIGCRLFYPDGTLQHGGVDLTYTGDNANSLMSWSHREAGSEKNEGGFAEVLGVCSAVTAACFMVKREVYERLEGFDEVTFPVAFSDTNFCWRLKNKLGLLSFYTPYAMGVHHESASRGKENIEDYEGSVWATQLQDDPEVLFNSPAIF